MCKRPDPVGGASPCFTDEPWTMAKRRHVTIATDPGGRP